MCSAYSGCGWFDRRSAPAEAQGAADKPLAVNVHNFVRAETDLYFSKAAIDDGAFGKLRHRRTMASVDKQDVVRMNRDTLYSSGVFDLDAAPLTITLPDTGKRFMSMQVISEDHGDLTPKKVAVFLAVRMVARDGKVRERFVWRRG
jgi:Protein of unknown function (DUF1254)